MFYSLSLHLPISPLPPSTNKTNYIFLYIYRLFSLFTSPHQYSLPMTQPSLLTISYVIPRNSTISLLFSFSSSAFLTPLLFTPAFILYLSLFTPSFWLLLRLEKSGFYFFASYFSSSSLFLPSSLYLQSLPEFNLS